MKYFSTRTQSNSKILSNTTDPDSRNCSSIGQVLSPGDRLGIINTEKRSDQLVSLTYFAVQDGKQIKPGYAEFKITPSTVKRRRFGGILGSH